ncbi:MAG: hypothetical protein LBQ54_07605 [Planctomycetaceae bacterium]|nr:hypothetical protein [Planctomycetaceae bacterium]
MMTKNLQWYQSLHFTRVTFINEDNDEVLWCAKRFSFVTKEGLIDELTWERENTGVTSPVTEDEVLKFLEPPSYFLCACQPVVFHVPEELIDLDALTESICEDQGDFHDDLPVFLFTKELQAEYKKKEAELREILQKAVYKNGYEANLNLRFNPVDWIPGFAQKINERICTANKR